VDEDVVALLDGVRLAQLRECRQTLNDETSRRFERDRRREDLKHEKAGKA